MRKVLIPTDFSTNALNAVKYAFDLFKGQDDIEYILLNAYDVPHGGSATMLVSITDILKRDSEVGLKKVLSKLELEGDETDHNIRTISLHGPLASVIEQLLKTEDFNLLVMGALGAGGIEQVLLGSSTSEVVKKIKKPILIVPHKARYVVPDKILLTTDFKPIRRDLQIERLRDFATNVDAEILVLNVHNEGAKLDLEKAKVSSGLEELLGGARHSYHDTINDDIIEGIDDFIKKNDIKILAMILRQLNFIDSIFHKSLTKEMAMHTVIPMLALHD